MNRTRAVLVLVGLAASAAVTLLAPVLMPDGYSWISRTTSEAAAQGISGAWLGRLGFLLFGLSVLLDADLRRRSWGSWGTGLHVAFGVFMTAAAAFSHRPWLPDLTFDATEDVLHSLVATAMGFAFAGGVVAVAVRMSRFPTPAGVLDVLAVVASVALPIAMTAVPWADGLLQRLMFAIAYLWYALEAARALRPAPAPERTDGDRHRTTSRAVT